MPADLWDAAGALDETRAGMATTASGVAILVRRHPRMHTWIVIVEGPPASFHTHAFTTWAQAFEWTRREATALREVLGAAEQSFADALAAQAPTDLDPALIAAVLEDAAGIHRSITPARFHPYLPTPPEWRD